MRLETIVGCVMCDLDVELEGGQAYCKACHDQLEFDHSNTRKLLERFLRHQDEGTEPDELFLRHVREALS